MKRATNRPIMLTGTQGSLFLGSLECKEEDLTTVRGNPGIALDQSLTDGLPVRSSSLLIIPQIKDPNPDPCQCMFGTFNGHCWPVLTTTAQLQTLD